MDMQFGTKMGEIKENDSLCIYQNYLSPYYELQTRVSSTPPTHYTLHIAHYISHITHHILHITHHTLHIKHHILHYTYL